MKTIVDTNYRGAVKLTANLIPFMATNGKIVNISSQVSQLQFFTPQIEDILKFS